MNRVQRLSLGALLLWLALSSSAADLRFTLEPADAVVLDRETVVLSSIAEATQPVSYQWFKGAFPIPNAATTNLSILIVDEQDGGAYRVRVKTATEEIFSRTATISVVRRPVVTITEPLAGASLPAGRNHRIAATNAPIGLTSVKFYSGDQILATLTEPPYEISTTLAFGEHTLRAVATTTRGALDTSAPVAIRVEELLPQFKLHPFSQRVMSGRTVEFRASVAGAGTVTYQWTRDGAEIPGANASNLIVWATASATYQLIAKNEYGETLSALAPLTVETTRPQFMQRFKRSMPTRPTDIEAYKSIAFGNGIILIVGSGGSIISSRDGLTWQDTSPPFTDTFMRVRFLNGAFWAVSEEGAVFNSADGLAWTRKLLDSTRILRDIGYLNGVYVALGNDRVFRSTDGVNWTSVVVPNASNLNSVTAGNGIFAMTSRQGGDQVHISSDGLSWQAFPLGSGVGDTSIVFFKGRFVVTTGLGIRTSADAKTWQTSLNARNSIPIVSPTRLLMLGDRAVARSEDGVAFVQETGTFPSFTVGGIYNGAAYYAIGSDTALGIASSLNGVSWTFFDTPVPDADSADVYVDFANDRFFAAFDHRTLPGSNRLLATSGSEPWTDLPAAGRRGIRSVIHANGKYIAATRTSGLYSSENGETFSPLAASDFPGAITIRVDEGEFLAVNDNTVLLRSPNGAAWTSQSFAGSRFADICKANGKAVAVGYFGALALSENGGPWEKIPLGTENIFYGVTAHDGRFVVVGNNGIMLYSTDGRSWYRGRQNFASGLKEVIFAEGMFLSAGDLGRIGFSWDGINWDFEQLHTKLNLLSIAAGNNRLVVGGNYGTMFQTDPLAAPEPAELAITADVTQNTITIQMLGVAGQTIRLESAADLPAQTWNQIGRFQMTGTLVPHTLPASQTQQFYRAVTE